MNRGLILDVDNTIYSWVDWFLPSLRSMIHKLSSELNIDEDEILDDFRQVYRVYGTVEYPNVIVELALWNRHKIPIDDKKRIIDIVKKVFSINIRKSLHLFPHVLDVLKWTKDERIIVIGLSDALEHWVCYRLRQLGVEKYFSGLYTWQNIEWFSDRAPARSSIKVRVQLSSHQLKPNPEIINKMVSKFSLDRKKTFMVGDSLSKDIIAAQSANIIDVWARYGTKPVERNLDTLKYITPWTESEKVAEKHAKSIIKPTHIIDDFSELVSLIGTYYPTLFD